MSKKKTPFQERRDHHAAFTLQYLTTDLTKEDLDREAEETQDRLDLHGYAKASPLTSAYTRMLRAMGYEFTFAFPYGTDVDTCVQRSQARQARKEAAAANTPSSTSLTEQVAQGTAKRRV